MMTTSTARIKPVILLTLLCSFPDYSSCVTYEASCLPVLKGRYNIGCSGVDGSKDRPTTVAIDRIIHGLWTRIELVGDDTYCNMGGWDDAPMYYGYIYCASSDRKACTDQLADGLIDLEHRCGKYRAGAQVVAPDGSCLRYERYSFCDFH